MSIRIFFLFFLCTFLALQSFSVCATEMCDTHTLCTNNTCQCVISAESAYDRYFYFEFQEIKKGHYYQCELNDALHHLSLKAATFPNGSRITYQSTSHTLFPVTIIVDTIAMVDETSFIEVKAFSPGISLPIPVTMSCKEVIND